MLGTGVLIGAIISGTPSISDALFGFLTALFIEAGIFAFNDYCDIDVDIANERFDRPLVRGDIQPRTAVLVSIIATFLGILCAFRLNFWCFVLAIVLGMLGIFYDVKMKEIGILGNVYVGFTIGVPFLFGGLIIQRISLTLIILSSIAFLSGVGREVMKGIMDIKGDGIRDVKTVARIHGVDNAKKVSMILYIIGVSLTPLPFILDLDGFRSPAYILPIILADLLFLHSCIALHKDGEKVNRLRKETLFAMVFGLIAFLSASLIKL